MIHVQYMLRLVLVKKKMNKKNNSNICDANTFITRLNLQQFADDKIEAINEKLDNEELSEEQEEIIDILRHMLPRLICDETLIATFNKKNNTIEIDFYEQNFNLALNNCCYEAIKQIADVRMQFNGEERTQEQKEDIYEFNEDEFRESIEMLFYSHLSPILGDVAIKDLPIFKSLDALRVVETVIMDFDYFNNLRKAKN